VVGPGGHIFRGSKNEFRIRLEWKNRHKRKTNLFGIKFDKYVCHQPISKLGLSILEVTLGNSQRKNLDGFNDTVELPDEASAGVVLE